MEDDTAQLDRIREHTLTPIAEVIVEEKLIAVVGRERREVILQIGRPYVADTGEARCPVATWGLDNRYSDICGEGTIQALNLACKLLHRRLVDSIAADAVRFYSLDDPDGEPLTVEYLSAIFGRSS